MVPQDNMLSRNLYSFASFMDIDISQLFIELFNHKQEKLPEPLLAKCDYIYKNHLENLSVDNQLRLMFKLAQHRMATRNLGYTKKLITKSLNTIQQYDKGEKFLGIFLNLYGNYHRFNGHYDKALNYYIEALKNDPNNPEFNANAGSTCSYVHNYDEAESYMKIASENCDEEENKSLIYRIALINAFILGRKLEHKKACEEFEKAVLYAEKHKIQDETFEANLLNLGISFYNLADNEETDITDEGRKELLHKAKKYLKKALGYSRVKKSYRYGAVISRVISKRALSEGNLEDAKNYIEESIGFAREYKNQEILIKSLKSATRVYEVCNEKDKVIAFYKEIVSISENDILELQQYYTEKLIEDTKGEIELQRLKNERIRKQKEELLSSNTLLKEYNKTIVHDLKEPLRTIQQFSNLLKEELGEQLTPEVKEILSYLHNSSVNAKRIVDDLKKLTDLDRNNSTTAQKENLDLSELLEDVKLLLNNQIKKSKTIVNIYELPTVKGVRSNYIQLFTNLISNAIKYNKSSEPEISISYKDEGENFVIAVKDNGIGIPTDQLENIFKQFVKIGTIESDGTGIGLSICRRIAQLNNGEIWAKSDLSKGSTFFIKIPK